MLVSKIISSIIEIILISSLPFIWWLISAKKKESFFNWIGLKKIENKKSTLINTIIILLTGIVAYAMGYVNEKKANGSILPSWIIHALSNIFASIIAMFSII